MKKFFAMAGFVACGLFTMACGTMTPSTTTTTRGGLVTGHFEDAQISAKDFEPVQLVFAQTTVDNTSGAFMTYDALIREAAKVGAHAIINVVIEDVKVCERNDSNFKTVCATTRYGSALAIKYKDALNIGQQISNDTRPRIKPAETSSNTKNSGNGGGFNLFGLAD